MYIVRKHLHNLLNLAPADFDTAGYSTINSILQRNKYNWINDPRGINCKWRSTCVYSIAIIIAYLMFPRPLHLERFSGHSAWICPWDSCLLKNIEKQLFRRLGRLVHQKHVYTFDRFKLNTALLCLCCNFNKLTKR